MILAAVNFAIAIILLWISGEKWIRWTVFAITMVISIGIIANQAQSADKLIVKASPDGRHLLALEIDDESGTVIYNKVYYGVLRKEKEQFPYTVDGKMKFQWLENDVCAVTYKGTDKRTHQYLATFGDRGNGNSYIDPKTTISGNWGISGQNHAGWQMQVSSGTVTLWNGSKEWVYESEDCVRFGTTALALCRNGYPEWSLVLNENCRINYNDLVARGGTLTLCEVSMRRTSLIEFECTDAKEEYSDTDPMLSAEESTNVQEEDTYFVSTQNEDELWNVRTALQVYDEGFRLNGVDGRVQINTIQRLEGDTEEGVYEINKTELLVSPGNQGESPTGEKIDMTYKIHMTKTDGGYQAHILGYGEKDNYGLKGDKSQVYDVSEQLEYHYFLAGEYDTTYMYVSRRSPEQGLQDLYDTQLQELYPNAELKEYDGMPYLDLKGNGKELLLYDGITEEYEQYSYQKVDVEDAELSPSTYMTMKETYQISITDMP